MLSRGEAEIVRELASGAEPLNVSDEGDQGRCRQEPDSGNLAKPHDDRHLAGESF